MQVGASRGRWDPQEAAGSLGEGETHGGRWELAETGERAVRGKWEPEKHVEAMEGKWESYEEGGRLRELVEPQRDGRGELVVRVS